MRAGALWDKRLGAVAAIAVAALLFAWLARPAPIRVDIAKALRGPLLVTVDEEGETRVRHEFVVAAPVSGRLQRIELEEGDSVVEGAVVARIDVAPLDPRTRAEAQARLEAAQAAKREAEAKVAEAEAALTQARRAQRRAAELARAGTLSDRAREEAELSTTSRAKELEAAQFASHAAEHEVERARAALLSGGSDAAASSPGAGDERGERDTAVDVRAPVRASVLRVLEKSERVVAVGTPLLTLGDTRQLEIVVDVLSADAVKVTPGAEVRIESWGGEGALRGTVRRIEPAGFTKVSALGVEEQRVNVIIDPVDPPPALGHGYRLEARIVVWEADDVLSVPVSALFRCGTGWCTFVVEGGRARRRELDPGHRSAARVEITHGLRSGEEVILHPTDRVTDGVRVTAF
ncbi:MAG TPA: HlyD family efflux transporter periplasmic adaptor subunit [Myxococcota bacterium]|nr:HlyD family efflux transporter periplasmic adaptor subunit [Myxococcota bacterium]